MLGLNIEYTAAWLSRQALAPSDLGGYRLLDSLSARLNVLRLLACAFAPGAAAEAELETAGLELLDPGLRITPPRRRLRPGCPVPWSSSGTPEPAGQPAARWRRKSGFTRCTWHGSFAGHRAAR